MGPGDSRKPIYSTLVDELEYRDSIDEFVIGLAERIDRLQDAERAGDTVELSDLARFLGYDASKLGFDLIASVANGAESACHSGENELLHEQLLELTELAQRVRRGHRGSV